MWGYSSQQLGMEVSDISERGGFVLNPVPLAEKLFAYEGADCYGEGPRFFKEYIGTAVGVFGGSFSGAICFTLKYETKSGEETAEM